MYGYQEARTRDGRLILIGKPRRIAHANRTWGYYNAVSIIWLDENQREISRESTALGKFNKEHKPKATGRYRVLDHGTQSYV